jgi:hypothetical protein
VRSHNTEDDDEEEDLQESVDLDELENSIRIDGPDAEMSGGSASSKSFSKLIVSDV